MEFKKDRKIQGGVITVIVLIVIVTLGMMVSGNSTLLEEGINNTIENAPRSKILLRYPVTLPYLQAGDYFL